MNASSVQMGSSVKTTMFEEHIQKALRKWGEEARERVRKAREKGEKDTSRKPPAESLVIVKAGPLVVKNEALYGSGAIKFKLDGYRMYAKASESGRVPARLEERSAAR